MRAVVTRVKSASVEIEGKVNGAIEQGFLVLLGVGPEDNAESAQKLAEKIYNVRVFSDDAGKMNLNLEQVGGSMLVISQFTLYADTRSRRPVTLRYYEEFEDKSEALRRECALKKLTRAEKIALIESENP